MDLLRILTLALLAGGCVATGPGAIAAIEASEAPARTPRFPLASSAPVPTQDSAEPRATASPHSVTGGVGIRFRDGESALSLLVEYHYATSPTLEVGALADWAGSPIDSLLVAPAAWWHPTDRLTLFGAPGLEFVSGDGAAGAVRVGGAYTLSLGRLAVRPFAWYDVVPERDDSFALGVGFGL